MSLTKEQFDRLYVGEKLVVKCDTESKANEFLKLADGFGYKWLSDESYINKTLWERQTVKMCYCLFKGSYGKYGRDFDLNNVVEYPQHKASPKPQFINFVKSDLQNGDIITIRRRSSVFVIENNGLYNNKTGLLYAYFDNWTDDLLDVDGVRINDILRVYRNDILIWQREECPEVSEKDKRIEHIETKLRKLADEPKELKGDK